MSKTGRNNTCPCGSKKKYKKCCLNKNDFKPVSVQDNFKTAPFFSSYTRIELLRSFAALSLIPENHGKNFRLERLIIHSLLGGQDKGDAPTQTELREYLSVNFTQEAMEDEPVTPFTDLITFYGGDYLIFPGISENGTDILNHQLTTLYHWPKTNVPDWVRGNIRLLVTLGLAISDHVARKLGYSRYMEGKDDVRPLHVPLAEHLASLKDAITITKEEMTVLMQDNSIDPQVLALLLLDTANITQNTLNQEDSDVIYHPIMSDGENYLVISPTTICLALSAQIWKLSKEWGVFEIISTAYHDQVWNDTKFHLGQMNFEPLEIEGFPENQTGRDGLYKIDVNKIAYVRYIGAHSINRNTGGSPENLVMDFLKTHEEYSNCQVMILQILGPIGETFMFPLQKVDGARTLALSAFDLEILYKLKKTNALGLWKFIQARDKMLEQNPGIRLFAPFLDQYKIYKENADSFYLSDEEANIAPIIIPGIARDWLMEAKLKKDAHSGWFREADREYLVPVERKDSYAPVYINAMDVLQQSLRFLVEEYTQPIWVIASGIPANASKALKNMYYQVTDALAYWLWQVNSSLVKKIAPLGKQPITVEFVLEPVESFEEISRDYTRKDNLENYFKLTQTQTGYLLHIPPELIAYLYGADNQGERVILMQLIKGFNLLMKEVGEKDISDEEINKMISLHAPLGMKKKFFVLDTANNLLLDPTGLERHRNVQEHDVSVVLDSIVPALGAECPPVGEIETLEQRNTLAHKIAGTVLMKMLLEKLSKLDSTKLLKELIIRNESLIRKREELRIHTPTRIECFVSEEQQINELQESLENINRSTIAVRCLIEQIAAEPCKGEEPVSITAIDELMAIMDQIISWGSMSDQIHFNLFDIAMAILPSGRVGTSKAEYNQVFDPYRKSKASENVQDAINTFQQVFPQNDSIEGTEVPQKLDNAFLKDFGISFNRICEFIEGLAHIGFEQGGASASVPLSGLRAEVNKYVGPFEEKEFNNAIAYLSLEDRGKLVKIDKAAGYEFIDIMPWRFNRMLSLMRKPLVLTGRAGDINRTAWWGPRQVLSSRIYLADQCTSGRLRSPKNATSIQSAIGDFAAIRGSNLVSEIVCSIDPTGIIVDTDQFIGPQYHLKHHEDIGDIDVLIIDPKDRVLYSLESKSISPSRSIKEMIEEVSKLVDEWIPKHMRRDEWIRNNLDQLGAKYGIDLQGFEVKSIFVTQEDMLTPHLKKMSLPLPFITSYDLATKGLKAVQEASI